MSSLKKMISAKYAWDNSSKDNFKKIVLVLFKDKVEIYICKILFMCDNYIAGARCHKSALEFMLNLNTGIITSSSISDEYLVLSPEVKYAEENLSILQTYHKNCELLIKNLLEYISRQDSDVDILPFSFSYI